MTNKEIAKAWFAAIDANNFEAVKNLMHPQHSFRNPMTPAAVGSEEHIGMMQMMTSAFEGGHDLELILTDGDYVTVSGRYKGKHTGEFNGMPASNKQVDFTFIDVFQIVDGKVRNEYFEMNPMSIMMQIGAMPANA
jgi:predicted ester cyclase